MPIANLLFVVMSFADRQILLFHCYCFSISFVVLFVLFIFMCYRLPDVVLIITNFHNCLFILIYLYIM